MVSDHQINELALSYVHDGDLKKFVLEFSKLSFNIRQHGNPAAIENAKIIESKLAEVYAGHLPQVGFRNWLRDSANVSPVGYSSMGAAAAFFNSVNRPAVVEKSFPALAATSGTLPVAGFWWMRFIRCMFLALPPI